MKYCILSPFYGPKEGDSGPWLPAILTYLHADGTIMLWLLVETHSYMVLPSFGTFLRRYYWNTAFWAIFGGQKGGFLAMAACHFDRYMQMVRKCPNCLQKLPHIWFWLVLRRFLVVIDEIWHFGPNFGLKWPVLGPFTRFLTSYSIFFRSKFFVGTNYMFYSKFHLIIAIFMLLFKRKAILTFLGAC